MDKNDNRSIVMAEIMTPDTANFSGHVHGGHLMQLLDKVAYACSARYAGRYVVTLSVDGILFKKPIFVGELVTFYASVNYVGTSSMEIGIRVIAENLMTREQRHTNTCYFTMVAIDETGKSIALPPLEVRTQIEKYRFEEAKTRRQLRIDYQKLHQEHKLKIRQCPIQE
ncbi:MAG: acyl-CoA thioesterase [Gammaproteobacteria bacterium]|jgi:acyl-CoA hydrolase|nr:acyl-CoA thioesterase [Gammaproteobacteria bacterium]